MIMFTFSVRNIPPHKSLQEYAAFNDNFLGANYVQKSSSHHPRQVLPLEVGAREQASPSMAPQWGCQRPARARKKRMRSGEERSLGLAAVPARIHGKSSLASPRKRCRQQKQLPVHSDSAGSNQRVSLPVSQDLKAGTARRNDPGPPVFSKEDHKGPAAAEAAVSTGPWISTWVVYIRQRRGHNTAESRLPAYVQPGTQLHHSLKPTTNTIGIDERFIKSYLSGTLQNKAPLHRDETTWHRARITSDLPRSSKIFTHFNVEKAWMKQWSSR